jgi:hypothetical protein
MVGRFTIAVVFALVGCGSSGGDDDGGDDEPSSCQQAFRHFYDAGCTYMNLESGAPISEGEMVSLCQEVRIAAPPQCEAEVDSWVECIADVPSTVTRDEQCDCSVEQESWLTCE